MKIKDILAKKGTAVVTIVERKTVHDALATFAANKVGSLLVLDEKGGIVGILAARDVLMAALKNCERLSITPVKEIMTKKIIIGDPEDDIAYVQTIMTENRIRHLPVVAEHKLSGIISIGDIVKAQLAEHEGVAVENRYLKDYIIGKYPA